MTDSNGLEDFIITGKIGNGQFSEVFKAIYIKTGEQVAIKKIHFYDMVDNSAKEECLKEVSLLQRLEHVNIIKYLGSFTNSSKLHIVLELAEAGDLATLIKHFRRVRRLILEKTIWKYFVQVSAALEYMHSNRIMHRDIKPANIFVTEAGVAKLGDLGLGRFFSHKTFAAQTIVGTPYYMSPERIKEKPYNFKSDVWSMGCLLYELAALKSPFEDEKMTLFTLIQKVENGDYKKLPTFAYSEKYRQLVDSCLKIDPSSRPTIKEVHDEAKKMHLFWTDFDNIVEASTSAIRKSKPYSFEKKYEK